MRHPRFASIALPLAAGIMLLAGSLFAKTETPLPNDLRPGGTSGLRGVLELDGDHIVNCGNVGLNLTPFGFVGSLPGSVFPFSTAPSGRWPTSSPNAVEYLWAAGIWVGAISDGEKRVSTTVPEFEFRPTQDPLAVIRSSREGALGGARLPAGDADDDGDGMIDEEILNGVDDDDDGLVDEDFAAISNQMLVMEYFDTSPIISVSSLDHRPLDLHVIQSSFCWEETRLEDIVGMNFKIIYEGADVLEEVYVGFFMDADIGNRDRSRRAEDDLYGFWEGELEYSLGNSPNKKKVFASIGYMFDDDGDEQSAEGYLGVLFLGAARERDGARHPLDGLRNFLALNTSRAFQYGGQPNNDEERFELLAGNTSLSLAPPGGIRPPKLAHIKNDYAMVMSVGPFDVMKPGDVLDVNVAMVFGQGFADMQRNAFFAQLTFDGVWLDCDQNPLTGVNGRETPICAPVGDVVRLNECDQACEFAPRSNTQCFQRVRDGECVWINADCNRERLTEDPTGIEGRECNVSWLAALAPMPPNMEVEAAQRSVTLTFDDRSETTPDPLSGMTDFESYRIWRAEEWTRPPGTTFETGPGSGAFSLLAEFDVVNGVGSDTGLGPISYEPDVPKALVEFFREWFEAQADAPPPTLHGYDELTLQRAQDLARGKRFHRFVDPQFVAGGQLAGPCPIDGECPLIRIENGWLNTRCNDQGFCQETLPPVHPGVHYFYAVTATDHRFKEVIPGEFVPSSPGIAGRPNSNFVYVSPPTTPTTAADFHHASEKIFVVPNPATPLTLAPWALQPNRNDASGVKIEFRHLPIGQGRVLIFTLSGDLVRELPFLVRGQQGTMAWNLLSRNGQPVTSGIYLYTVESDSPDFETFVSKFVVVR